MKRSRWEQRDFGASREEVDNPKIDAFLEEVISVCRKHGFSISHEDGQGAFVVENIYEQNFVWLLDATDATGLRRE